MKTAIKSILLGSAFCATTLIASAVSAQTIRVASWLPPTNPMNQVVIPAWGEAVKKATEGRVDVEIIYGLGHPKTMWNMVEDGIVEASYSYHGYVPGRFELPQIVEQPGLGANAEAASYALWKTYDKYFKDSGEFGELKLLALFTHGPGQIHSKFEVNSVADLENKKIRIGGGVQSIIAEEFHVTPVGAPAPKVYEMMQQGVIDGAFLPAVEQRVLRLSEVTSHLTLLPEGLYMGSFSMFMDPAVFDELSEADQAAINAISGEKLSILAGKAWDESDASGIQAAKDAGVKVKQLSPDDALTKEFQTRLDPLAKHWIDAANAKGFKGQEALDYLRSEAKQYVPGRGE